jgi:hypothetical protein
MFDTVSLSKIFMVIVLELWLLPTVVLLIKLSQCLNICANSDEGSSIPIVKRKIIIP